MGDINMNGAGGGSADDLEATTGVHNLAVNKDLRLIGIRENPMLLRDELQDILRYRIFQIRHLPDAFEDFRHTLNMTNRCNLLGTMVIIIPVQKAGERKAEVSA